MKSKSEVDAASRGGDRVHVRPLRAVMALRVFVLIVLAGFAMALVLSFGRRGGRSQTRITMAPVASASSPQGAVMDLSDEFKIEGSREGRPAFTLRARTVTGFAGERKLLEAVRLTVYEESGGAVEIAGAEGQFDASTRRAQLEGNVAIDTGDGVSLRTGTLFYDSDRDVIFTADEVAFAAGGIEGEGRGLNYLAAERQIKIPDRVVLRVTGEDAGPPLTVTSGDLIASLPDNVVTLSDDVKLVRGGDNLRANYLKLYFDEQRRRVGRLSAFGEVAATLSSAAGGAGHELHADSLTARMSGRGQTIEEAEASGNCRFAAGVYTARSRSARYEGGQDRLELRGDPVVMTDRDRIAAQEIDLHPDRQVVEARGDVRTVSLPGPVEGPPGAPGFSGRSAVSFQARELHADRGSGRVVYSGSARAWQEGNSIQGERIEIDQAARQLRASVHVMARFTQRRTDGRGASGRPTVTSITAGSLVFDDAPGVGRYRDHVRLTRLDATLTADAMDVYLKSREGRRDLDRIEASGSVAMKRGGSFGTARQAEYLGDEDLLILKDDEGLAEVVDAPTGRTMRGRTLTFDLAGDRILAESARGGRTWITLKPETKEVQSVEPKTDR
jgi:LPS export ABC transporter protein LptC